MARTWKKISMTIHDFGLSEPIYTVNEAASILGCSPQTLNRWHNNGVAQAFVYESNNRKYRYYDDELIDSIRNSDAYMNLPCIRNSDLLGRRFGKLTVRSFSDIAKQKGYYGSYNCLCDCGNEIIAARSELFSGKCLSCGCKYKDLSGSVFGEWHVDSYAGKYVSPSGDTCIQYNCTCSCGEKRIVLAQSLLTGRSYSCGCSRPEGAMSKAEVCVLLYFEEKHFEKNSDFTQYKTFPDLVGVGGGHLSYDFHLIYNHENYLIECQGGQHYYPVELWGGKSVFERQQIHDQMKRDYARLHGYKLIEIPYTMFSYKQIETLLNDILGFRAD